jgi:DNA primase
LISKGANEQDLIDAGLIVKPEDGRPTYDRFRNRVIIPIHDEKGRVVAFGGRLLSDEGGPKYLNSPETPLFQKSHLLFNMHRARKVAYDLENIIVVEGYFDVISLFQAGIQNVVAPLGTSLTEDQIKILWRNVNEPLICFDGDRAGQAAAYRILDRALPILESGHSLNFAFIRGGKDPDEIIKQGGKEAFKAEIKDPITFSGLLWERELQRGPLDTPERRAALEKRLEELVQQIKDVRLSRRYRLSYRVQLSDLFWKLERQQRGVVEIKSKPVLNHLNLERTVLGLCVEYPDIFESHVEAISTAEYSLDIHKKFCEELCRIVLEFDHVSVETFYKDIRQEFFFVLNEVHGGSVNEGAPPRPRGHKLRERFPILKCAPPTSFIEQCLLHFLEYLHIRAQEKELAELVKMAPEGWNDGMELRVLTLQSDLLARRGAFSVRDTELADEAALIRRHFENAESQSSWPGSSA